MSFNLDSFKQLMIDNEDILTNIALEQDEELELKLERSELFIKNINSHWKNFKKNNKIS